MYLISMRMKSVLLTILLVSVMTLDVIASPVKVRAIKLKNGLTVWLNEDHSQPKVVGGVVVKIGAKDSPNTGIAHYFEHIMFKGTDRIGTIDYAAERIVLDKIEAKYDELRSVTDPDKRMMLQKEINDLSIEAAKYAIPNDFNNLISKYGGAQLNAATSFDYTIYHNVFTPQYLEHWCELNSERLISPVFRLFQSELETVYEEKNMYDDRMASGAMKAIIDRFAAPHPYRYEIIGSTDALKNPDLRAMRDFFDKYYVAGNMGLVLTGDFDAETAIPIIERTFGRIRPGEAIRPVAPKANPFKGAERFNVKFPIPFVSASLMAWHAVPTTHEDREALEVMVALFTNDGGTGLLDRLSMDGKLMMAQGAFITLDDMGALMLLGVPNIPFGTARSAQKMLKDAIRKVKAGEFDDATFHRIKHSVLKTLLLNLEKPMNRAYEMAMTFASGLTWDDYEARLGRIEALTKEDIVHVANKYFTENYLDVRKKTGRYPKDKISKPPFAPIIPPNRGAESPFAKYLDSLPVNNKEIRPIDFENEAKPLKIGGNDLATLYMTENTMNDLFSLDIVYHKGQYNNRTLSYLEAYMPLIGTHTKSAHEINEAFQNIGTSITWQVGAREEIRIGLVGYDKYFVESVRLLHDFVFNAKADDKKVKKLVDLKKLDNKALKQSTNDLANHLSSFIRYGEDSDQRRQLSLSEVKRLKGEELIALLREVLETEADFHYVGTLSQEDVLATLREGLRTDKIVRKGDAPVYFPSASHGGTTKVFFVDDPKANQTIIRAYLNMEKLSPEDMKRAELYGTYLGRGMSSLLFQEVREYRSLAYGVSGWYEGVAPIFNGDKGDIVLYMSTQADKTSDAIALLDSLVRVSPDERERFTETRQTLTNSAYALYPELRHKTRYVSALRRRGHKQDVAARYLDIVKSVTQEELMDFHSRKVAPGSIVYTIVGNGKRIDMEKIRTVGEVIEMKQKDFVKF